MLHLFSLCVYLYKLYVYNLCRVHSAIHVSLSVIQQSANRSGNITTNQMWSATNWSTWPSHLCYMFGELIGWQTNFQIPWRQTEETRAELCDWRKGKLVIGGEDSRVTGTAAWPPNSYSVLAWRKCSKHIWIHGSSWSLKVRAGYHVHFWYRSNLQHLTWDVWCKSSIFAQYGLLICLLQSSICNIWDSNYIWS